MANYSTLKAAVADVVKTNGAQAITGANLQSVLLSIINSVGGGGYIFKGVATPSTDAGTPDENVFYIGGAGTYANFGTSVTVPVGSICVFKYNGSWTKEQIALFAGIDDVPTVNSNNLVKSGGVVSTMLSNSATQAGIPYTVNGYYVNLNSATIGQAYTFARVSVSQYSYWLIPCKSGYEYKLTTQVNTNNAKAYAILDENNVVLDLQTWNVTDFQITIPSGGVLLIVNSRTDTGDNYSVVDLAGRITNAENDIISIQQHNSEQDTEIIKNEQYIRQVSLSALQYQKVNAVIRLGVFERGGDYECYLIEVSAGDEVAIYGTSGKATYYAFLTNYSDSDVSASFCTGYSGAGEFVGPGLMINATAPTDAKYLYVMTYFDNDREPNNIWINNISIYEPLQDRVLNAIHSPYFKVDKFGRMDEAAKYIKELYIINYSYSDNITLESYGVISNGNFKANFFIDNNNVFSLEIPKGLLSMGEQLAVLKVNASHFPVGYALVDASALPSAATNQSIQLTNYCFDIKYSSGLINRITQLIDIIDFSKRTEMNIDFSSIAEAECRAFTVRPSLTIPNRDDAIIIASNIEDYSARGSQPTDEELIKAFAPFLYYKLAKIGTFVLYDENTGAPFIYNKDGLRVYLSTN